MDTNRQEKLFSKYFYIPSGINFLYNRDNLFNELEKQKERNEKSKGNSSFEEVESYDNKIDLNQKRLKQIQTKSIKEMIMNNKKIPKIWMRSPNYKKILKKVIKDPKILNCAVNNDEYYYKKLNKGINTISTIDNRIQISEKKSLINKEKSEVNKKINKFKSVSSIKINFPFNIKNKFKILKRGISQNNCVIKIPKINNQYKNFKSITQSVSEISEDNDLLKNKSNIGTKIPKIISSREHNKNYRNQQLNTQIKMLHSIDFNYNNYIIENKQKFISIGNKKDEKKMLRLPKINNANSKDKK